MGVLRRVFVHIGPPKTGTTSLQNVLWLNQAALGRAGFVVPGKDWPAQRRAATRLMAREAGLPVRPPERGEPPRDAWDRLVREVESSGAHTALVSVEQLSDAEGHSVRALVESLAPAQVHVVYAARDLAPVVPAEWQTRLRNRRAPSWAEYVASVRDPAGPDSYGGAFWRRHDPAATLRPYLEHLPPERVHVLVVPATGSPPGTLWQRWCEVTGLEPAGYDLDVSRSNPSLGGVEAEVMRRITAAVVDWLPGPAYGDVVKGFLAREVLERRDQSFRLVLPAREHEWLDPRARAGLDYLGAGGFPVVGDLDEALPVRSAGGREPDDVSDAEVLELMEEVLAVLMLELARHSETP